jgi:hypothetical protein
MGSVSVSGDASMNQVDVNNGDLGSFHSGGDIYGMDFDVEGSIWWLNANGRMRKTNVDARNLNAVQVGGLGKPGGGGAVTYRLTDEPGGTGPDSWWLGVGGNWQNINGPRVYQDDPR